jgi:hypothetical protein
MLPKTTFLWPLMAWGMSSRSNSGMKFCTKDTFYEGHEEGKYITKDLPRSRIRGSARNLSPSVSFPAWLEVTFWNNHQKLKTSTGDEMAQIVTIFHLFSIYVGTLVSLKNYEHDYYLIVSNLTIMHYLFTYFCVLRCWGSPDWSSDKGNSKLEGWW